MKKKQMAIMKDLKESKNKTPYYDLPIIYSPTPVSLIIKIYIFHIKNKSYFEMETSLWGVHGTAECNSQASL
jgi:hypothetical protein